VIVGDAHGRAVADHIAEGPAEFEPGRGVLRVVVDLVPGEKQHIRIILFAVMLCLPFVFQWYIRYLLRREKAGTSRRLAFASRCRLRDDVRSMQGNRICPANLRRGS